MGLIHGGQRLIGEPVGTRERGTQLAQDILHCRRPGEGQVNGAPSGLFRVGGEKEDPHRE